MKSKILKIIEGKHKISAGHNGVYVSDLMIELDCKYSDIKGVLNQLYTDNNHWAKINTKRVKEIPDRRFDFNKKVWIVPIAQKSEVLQLAQKSRAKIRKIENQLPEVTGEIPQLPDLDFDLPIHHPEGYALRPYQRKGVARGLQLKRFINGDDMGLGKTCQSISTIYGASLQGEDVFPCLVICPAAVKINWQREWQKR